MRVKRLDEILLFMFLFLLIPPSRTIFGFNLPILYLFIPILTFVVMFVIFGWIKSPLALREFMLFWFLIVLEVLISGVFGPLYLLSVFNFPAEILQYVARFLFFTAFAAMFYNSKISGETFLKYFMIVLLVAMSIGIMQWVPWPGQGIMLRQYVQVNRDLSANVGRIVPRVPGIAQMATATGGLAAFVFAVSLSILISRHHCRKIAILGIILSIINLVICMARGGMLAVPITMAFLIMVFGKNKRNAVKSFLIIILLGIILWSSLVFLYQQGNPYVVSNYDRWLRLFEQLESGGNRIRQIEHALSLLDDPYSYVFGVSRGFQTLSDVTFHLEVEPVNILVLYGIVGFLLQYGLVIALLVYYYKQLKHVTGNNTILCLTLASLGGLFSYQVFSVAYFFFREINVGLFPWIFFGATVGIIERYLANKKAT